ncbi:MAG: UDP-3-O-(3-hydroxymyristoyl)glucosamine N-acyltransferase [Planctomycetota bacterium]|jgi:UDP-3-O-[3-hydroxymyristoyl] glucosamine N-acyltransferase
MVLTVTQLAKQIGAELIGDGAGQIQSVAAVELANSDQVTFVSSARHITSLEKSQAGAAIVAKQLKADGFKNPQLIVEDVSDALIKALTIFAPKLKPAEPGIDETAKIGENVKIAKGVSVGPYVIIEDDVQIGSGTVISAGCKIRQSCKIGENCRFDNNVVVSHSCTIGNNVIIQANSVIGSTGFGYTLVDSQPKLIPHNGGVVIEDFVEIGACVCIDRAKFGNTIIGAATKLDNLVHIAHNVQLGRCCLIAGQVGIAGSSKVGDGVIMGGQAGLSDNIEVGNAVMVGGQAGVFHSAKAGIQVFGSPAIEKTEAIRNVVLMKRLPKQLKQLSARIKELEASKNNKKPM